MVNVQIDNKIILVPNSGTLIQTCSSIGIQLPRFCYHNKLPVAANCRMCLIQLEDSNKPIAACAVNIQSGMRLLTNSSLIKQARESVLEFLLINHPLDCPICDQGGECDLQDQTMIFGSDRGRFYEKKRAVSDFNLGLVIKTNMTRCIHCTRCIRYVQNITNSSELGLIGRGNKMRVTTFIKTKLISNLSGNLADICPVGALTSKPYAFTARPWELISYVSIDINDSLGIAIRIDVRGNEIMRILPYGIGLINDEWVTDKTRYSFDGFKKQRIIAPIIIYNESLFEINQKAYNVDYKESFFLLKKIVFEFLLLNKCFHLKKKLINLKLSSVIDLNLLEVTKIIIIFLKYNFDIVNVYDEINNNYLNQYILKINTFKKHYTINNNIINTLNSVYFIAADIELEFSLLYYKLSQFITNLYLKSISVKSSNNKLSLSNIGLSPIIIFDNLALFELIKNKIYSVILLSQSFLFRKDFNKITLLLDAVNYENSNFNYIALPVNTTTMHYLDVG